MKDVYKYAKVFLLVLMFGLSCQGFAAQDLKMSYDGSQVSDNYYVPAGGVYISPEGGMFVLIDGSLMQVSMLCSDEKGVFVPGPEMNRRFVRCPFCQGWYDPEHPENHRCRGSPD